MKKTITLLTMSFITHLMFAQFGPATPPTDADFLPFFPPYTSDIPPTNVLNTGVASCWYDDPDTFEPEMEFRVSVWDGAEPSFNWSYNGLQGTVRLQAGSLGMGYASDPDVVVSPGLGTDARIMIFYVLNGDVFGEAWMFDGTGCTPAIMPGLMSSGDCPTTSPNADITPGCGVVLVWEECNTIRGRYLGTNNDPMSGFCFVGPRPIIELSTCVDGNKSQPDVSLFNNGVDNLINVVYINNTSSDEQLVLQRHTAADLAMGLPVTCDLDNTFILKSVPSLSQALEVPRVASIWNMAMPGINPRDCEVVVRHRSLAPPFQEDIVGFNHMAVVHGVNVFDETVLNAGLWLNYCGYNALPVVAYTGCNQIMVEWEYSGQCLFTGPGPLNIIATKLDVSGNIIDNSNYTAVTDNENENNRFPSVAGRFLLGSPTDVTSLFYNEGLIEIQYTHTTCAGLLARKKSSTTASLLNEEGTFSIFPNPSNTSVEVQLELGEDQEAIIQVFTVSGQIVSEITTAQNRNEIGTSNLPNGVYVVSVELSDRITTKKLIVRH